MFTALFVSLFVLGWTLCGSLTWLAFSVATRGNAGIGMLPMSIGAALVAGIAVPILVRDDAAGLWLSLGAAIAVSAALLGARRFASGPRDGDDAAMPADKEASP